MTTLRDKLWIWGQSPNVHYLESNNIFKLPSPSRMTAMEGAVFFDIPNMCRVRMCGHPTPPFDQESLALDTCAQVVWSLLGASGEEVTEWADIDEVARQATLFPNVTGGVFDDFFSPHRTDVFTPEKLRQVKKRLVEKSGRDLDMWVVAYEFVFKDYPDVEKYLQCFDVITYWTWFGENLIHARENIEKIIALAPGKRVMAGCYMWDYGNQKPYTEEQMKMQTELYLSLLQEKKIDGIIVCSNCIADMDIDAVRFMRNWIKEHKQLVLK